MPDDDDDEKEGIDSHPKDDSQRRTPQKDIEQI